MRNDEARVAPGPDAFTPTVAADAAPVHVPPATLRRIATLLDYAYEATWAAAEAGRIEWGGSGEPIVEALRLVRELAA